MHSGSVNGGLMASSGGSIESQMRSLADLAFLMQVSACAANSVPNGNAHNIPTLKQGTTLCACSLDVMPCESLCRACLSEPAAKLELSLTRWKTTSLWPTQDYETALSTLRLLCSDLKTDKRWRQYASAQVCIPWKECMPFPHCLRAGPMLIPSS